MVLIISKRGSSVDSPNELTDSLIDLIVALLHLIGLQLPTAILLALSIYLIIIVIRDNHRRVNTLRLYREGRFREARELWEKPTWQSRFLASVRYSAAYNQALCLRMERRIEESLRMLKAIPLDECDRNMRYAVETSLASNIVLLGQDPETAIAALDRVREIRETAEDLLILAHAELSRGNREIAQQHFNEASTAPDQRLAIALKSSLIPDRELEEVSKAFLRGWYLCRIGRDDEARLLLDWIATSKLDTIYRHRAQELLDELDEEKPDTPD